MEARYHIRVHCGDDGFQGPEEVPIINEAGATIATIKLQKNSQGPGMLDVCIDLPIDPNEVRFEDDVLIPPDRSRQLEDIALYIADMLAFQTRWGDLASHLDDAFEEYLPESAEERHIIEGKMIRAQKTGRVV